MSNDAQVACWNVIEPDGDLKSGGEVGAVVRITIHNASLDKAGQVAALVTSVMLGGGQFGIYEVPDCVACAPEGQPKDRRVRVMTVGAPEILGDDDDHGNEVVN